MLWPILLNPAAKWLAGAAAVLAILFAAYTYGKSVAREEARKDALIEFSETMERISDEDADLTDPAAVRERLCALAGLDPCPVPRDED